MEVGGDEGLVGLEVGVLVGFDVGALDVGGAVNVDFVNWNCMA